MRNCTTHTISTDFRLVSGSLCLLVKYISVLAARFLGVFFKYFFKYYFLSHLPFFSSAWKGYVGRTPKFVVAVSYLIVDQKKTSKMHAIKNITQEVMWDNIISLMQRFALSFFQWIHPTLESNHACLEWVHLYAAWCTSHTSELFILDSVMNVVTYLPCWRWFVADLLPVWPE